MSQHCRANPCCGDVPCTGVPIPQHESGLVSHNKCRGGEGSGSINDYSKESIKTIEPDQSQKKDAGKFDPMMIEEDLALALEGVNAVLEFGKKKYGKRGGWKAVDIERYRSAQARHRRKVMQNGLRDTDDETDLLHIAHEVCNGLFILQNVLAGMTPAQREKALTYKEPVPVNG